MGNRYSTIDHIKYNGRLVALASFVYGTLILVGFLIFKDTSFEQITISIGLGYVGVAFIINVLAFVILFFLALYYKHNRYELFGACGVLLLNIPVAIGYFLIVVNVMGF